MKFEQFWDILSKELQQEREFTTISYGVDFKACFKNNTIIITPKNSQKIYKITYEYLERAWDLAKNLLDEQRFKYSIYAQNKIRRSSYVIVFFKTFVGNTNMQ